MPCERDEKGLIPFPTIRKFVDEIVEKFQPDKVFLFGSYAYGEPNEHSDVDLLVVMPAKNQVTQALRIRRATSHPFPLDLLVRTPETLAQWLEWGDSFLREITTKGRLLYEKNNNPLGPQGRRGSTGRPNPRRRITAPE
jgi:predicted nucleotidyltransferase